MAGDAAASPTAPTRHPSYVARSNALVHTDASLLRARSPRRVTVFAKLDEDPVALYAGGLPGLPATSPSVTGHRIGPGPGRTRSSRAAVGAYLRHLGRVESRAVGGIRAAVPAARVLYGYRYVYGGGAGAPPADPPGRPPP